MSHIRCHIVKGDVSFYSHKFCLKDLKLLCFLGMESISVHCFPANSVQEKSISVIILIYRNRKEK